MKYYIDRSKWQKPSYGGHYDEIATEYEGIRCRCDKCEGSFVFEPEEQKRQFELLGRFPFWIPRLCSNCQNDWEIIGPRLKLFEEAWHNQKLEASDQNTLKEWLKLIEQSASYRKKDYSSRANMLKKLLAS
jgi:hypothetical protein